LVRSRSTRGGKKGDRGEEKNFLAQAKENLKKYCAKKGNPLTARDVMREKEETKRATIGKYARRRSGRRGGGGVGGKLEETLVCKRGFLIIAGGSLTSLGGKKGGLPHPRKKDSYLAKERKGLWLVGKAEKDIMHWGDWKAPKLYERRIRGKKKECNFRKKK